MIGTNTGISVRCVLVIQPKGVSENQLVAEDGPRGYWLEADNQNREYRPENRLYVNASCRRSARCLDVLSLLPFGIMRSYPGFCRSKQLEYNPGLTHRRRAGHPRANRRTSDRPSFCGVRPSCSRVIMSCHMKFAEPSGSGAPPCTMPLLTAHWRAASLQSLQSLS